MLDNVFQSKTETFLREFEDYIGSEYLTKKDLSISQATRFSDLNFDIVDEVITEELVNMHFGTAEFILETWPETIGDLLIQVRAIVMPASSE